MDGDSGTAPCGHADLDQATSLARSRHVHTAWPEPSPHAPGRGINHLTLAPSYAVLCAAQAAVVLVPRRPRRRGRLGWAGVVLPSLALCVGVLVLRLAAGGPGALAWLAALATPLLAAANLRRAPFAIALWIVAWLAHGLVAQAASVLLIALAAVTIAELAAAVAPEWSLVAGLVVLALVDVVLVWGTPQVGPASAALHHATVRSLPRLQDATFGSATMGWLDFVAAALVGVLARARLRAAVTTLVAAGSWGLLLILTPTVPATVPTLAGLLAGRP